MIKHTLKVEVETKFKGEDLHAECLQSNCQRGAQKIIISKLIKSKKDDIRIRCPHTIDMFGGGLCRPCYIETHKAKK